MVMHAGSYPDGISPRVQFDAAAEVLVAPAGNGTVNLHCSVHGMKPFNQAPSWRTGLPAIINRRCGVRDDIRRRELLSGSQSRKKARLSPDPRRHPARVDGPSTP